MRRLLLCALLVGACVPADEALSLGSVQFTFTASERTVDGLPSGQTRDQYSVTFDRVVLGFKTMTVGKIGAPDTCSYRGRGAVTDVVFDPRFGLVQTFNGIQPVDCPDVGVIFGAPENTTVPAEGTASNELVALAEGGFHALVDATATPPPRFGRALEPYKLELRFDPITTSTRFGGCRAATKGVRIIAGSRDSATVRFAAENLFRETISNSGDIRVAPFAQADAQGNNDHVVTMAELDELQLSTIIAGDFYQLPTEARAVGASVSSGTFGDFVRFLFRFTLQFRNEGLCIGNPPGGG